MSSGKLYKRGERHKCRKPVNWLWKRLVIGDIFVCECGKEFVWSFRRVSAPVPGDCTFEYYWREYLVVKDEA